MLRTGMWRMTRSDKTALSGCAEIMHSADSDAAQEASMAQVSESLLLERMKKRQENSSASCSV